MFEFLCKQLEAAVLKNGDIFLEKRLSDWKSKLIENRMINLHHFLGFTWHLLLTSGKQNAVKISTNMEIIWRINNVE